MKSLEFFFDLASPYSYLAATQLPALVARTGCEVAWKPFVLGAVFKATGNDMPAKVDAKARFMLADLPRWAKQYGVPFQMSRYWPLSAIKPERMILVAAREGKDIALSLALFRAMWVENRDIKADHELEALAAEVGLDPKATLAACDEPEIKDQLRAHTDDAIRRGAFGAPTFFVGQELFWGNDRLQHVESALA